MSRFYSTGKDLGLSRQSSKSYKAVCQKSNAELIKTLRRLDIEHHSNIARILNERYNLRTIQHDLKRFGEYDSCSESDSEEEEPRNGEIKKQSAFTEIGKKQSVCQLPCIIEEACVFGKPKSPKVLWPSPLPPLSERGMPTRPRKSSDGSLGNPAPIVRRERSSTLPVGKMPGDKQRQAEFRKVHKVSESREGVRAGNDGIHQSRSKDDDVPKERLAGENWEEVKKCRYLRRRRHTSPDLYKTS